MRTKSKHFSFLVAIPFFFILSINTFSQNWGMSLGASIESTVFGDFFYNKGDHYFHFGGTYQITDAKGEEKSERKSNYGLTTDGSGDKFYTIDIGYGYEIIDTLVVFIELSIGQKKYYTNYIDNRFDEGGYHLIDKEETITGIGIGGSYKINKQFMLFLSFNSVRKLGLGLRYVFNVYR
ncbi:MAG: hypothetical protein K9J16_16725 [Melioribacteraceae bacterium]|nr:hypothetical protein [Melioribacteraceae bacterium]MCF8356899.1 hypothetical protein [Melioribacteraceae bacterium]MCF8394308.1 hypothetical protein [Melioribacteraceae bacterium]MCF8419987.1 hypothetical protein [Melioribacteraceae bacterium]